MSHRLAILGDSDSHGYQDRVWFRAGTGLRGGPGRAFTLQWTEALARLRGDQLDLGRVRRCGVRRPIARWAGRLGLGLRTPRKHDHEHNFAFSGAGCADLVEGSAAQVPALLRQMRSAAATWRDGVVVVRVGIVDLGSRSRLEQMAADPDSSAVRGVVDGCLEHVREAVARLRAAHPGVGLVLVGVLDNVDHPPQLPRFRDPDGLQNISRALDRYDDGLRALVDGDPRGAFFNDRAWFRGLWGGRDASGAPAYRSVSLGSYAVDHRAADDPLASVLSDGHAGLAWNLRWCQALARCLATDLGLPVRAIDDGELGRFFDEQVAHIRRG
jgi:lysophospholipase L1-like esterase